MDFFKVASKSLKSGQYEYWPEFLVLRSKDLMIRGRTFYAVWDDAVGLWSTDEYDVPRLIDAELWREAEKTDKPIVKTMLSADSQSWARFRRHIQNISDNYHQLDNNLTFQNTEVKKSDYVSRRLPYSLAAGDHPSWDELVGTLYSVEERAKIEWAIGAIVSGDSKKIQKFLVLYGPAGTGKSTILNIVHKLFEGYTSAFEAKALGSNNGSFATEAFKDNPLVAIQHDGDLSKIEDNTRLNSIIAHEDMTINEKYKASYTARINAFLFMGTNQPVKISDAKSGIIRRLIDVHPTGVKIPSSHYHTLMTQIDFELGAIAQHCLEVYRSMGKNYYNGYRPTEMMFQTDVFFNFIEATYDVFKSQNYVSIKQAYTLYKEFCADTGIDKPLALYKVRGELQNYFDDYHERYVDAAGNTLRSVFTGFNANKFKAPAKEANTYSLVIEETTSLLDEMLAEQPAQGATTAETPRRPWASVRQTLADIDTSSIHFVKVPDNHIVIDFDLKDINGEKSLDRNLKAATAWPATYAELSKSGAGVHLHYIYDGDVSELRSEFSEGIEIKVYRGDASLRRRLSKCNNVPVASISSGLPLKEKKMLNVDVIKSEKGLRDLIERNLRKEIHPGTKPSVDFIKKILDDAYNSGLAYDLTDMRPRILAFANNSSNQSLMALRLVQQMRFASEAESVAPERINDDRIAFYDVEVYPNLFVVCWKFDGAEQVTKMVNPSPQDIEGLMHLKLVGFNNRRYDNHIMYARYLGADNAELYKISQSLIDNQRAGTYGEAYNLSYTDIYDFSSKKQGLKKFGVELGMHHIEMDIPWDQPVPDDQIEKVVAYCVNDVLLTEATFHDRKGDFVARQILAELSGLSVNDSTQKHTARIIFGTDQDPQSKFVYTDLSEMFPGYEFDLGKSTYRGEVVGEGGYVYSEPGIYEDVAELDVASMHPTSIEQLELFGPYTPNFADLKAARIAIKHGDFDAARGMLGGRLRPYLEEEAGAKELSYALKIVINIVYGLTSAKFPNLFKDNRNKDNIVAKRGALFMIDLKHAVQELGYQVVHIKTDSIKIPNADKKVIEFVQAYGRKYGYDFEHEATYDKFCLVNDAVYIAKKTDCLTECWTAVGAQFAHPYVYKTLFSHEDVTLEDLYETKSVMKGALYIERGEELQHIGRIGRFLPVNEKSGLGGTLYRIAEDKRYAASGSKGYLWVEASIANETEAEPQLDIDMSYYEQLIVEAKKAINKYGDFDKFAE